MVHVCNETFTAAMSINFQYAKKMNVHYLFLQIEQGSLFKIIKKELKCC